MNQELLFSTVTKTTLHTFFCDLDLNFSVLKSDLKTLSLYIFVYKNQLLSENKLCTYINILFHLAAHISHRSMVL